MPWSNWEKSNVRLTPFLLTNFVDDLIHGEQPVQAIGVSVVDLAERPPRHLDDLPVTPRGWQTTGDGQPPQRVSYAGEGGVGDCGSSDGEKSAPVKAPKNSAASVTTLS